MSKTLLVIGGNIVNRSSIVGKLGSSKEYVGYTIGKVSKTIFGLLSDKVSYTKGGFIDVTDRR